MKEAGTNSFVLSPSKWIAATDAIGIVFQTGKYREALSPIKILLFEFAAWISAEFKLYLIKEFQRLKRGGK